MNKTEIFIERIKNKRDDFHNFDLSKLKFIDMKTSIEIECLLCGHIFYPNPEKFLYGKVTKCPKCTGCGNVNYTRREAIKKIESVHKNKFLYDKFKYINNSTSFILICKKHGEFKTTLQSITHAKHGCKKCSFEKQSEMRSLGTKKFIKLLEIPYSQRNKIKRILNTYLF